MKTFEQYQQWVNEGIVGNHKNAPYMGLGLAGEAGETCNALKRVAYDDNTTMQARIHILEEMGDTLWYLAGLAHTLGFTLEEVASYNVDKLNERYGTRGDCE